MLRSLNFKVLILFAILLVLLSALVFRVLMVRRRRVEWLRNLNRQILSLEIEDGDEKFERASHREAEGETESRKFIDQPELKRILDSFNDYNQVNRARSEAALYEHFNSLAQSSIKEERAGKTGNAQERYGWFFGKLSMLGSPYQFERTGERELFLETLMSDWSKLPYLSRRATIRMLGVVGDARSRGILNGAVREGAFGDEASIALLKTGDSKAVPILLDYIYRGRISGKRYREVVEAIASRGDREVTVAIIEELDDPNRGIRSAALGLLEKISAQLPKAPKNSSPDDDDLKQKWARWWLAARSSYEFPKFTKRDIFTLDTATELDSIPGDGGLGGEYFAELASGIEDCCWALRNFDLGVHKRGETALYRLARQMVNDSSVSDKRSLELLNRYMELFIKEIEKICLRQRFAPSPERKVFVRWASANLPKVSLPIRLFLVRLLGIVGDQETIESLRPYAESKIPKERRAVLFSMGRLGSPEVIVEVREMNLDNQFSLADTEAIMEILERIGNAEAVEALVELLRTANPIVAYEAYLSLRKLRGQWGRALSLEEVEQARAILADDYSAWNRSIQVVTPTT